MKVIEASDVIIQVLDARDPLGSRCVDVERMVHKAGPLKRIVLLLNKIGEHLYSLLPLMTSTRSSDIKPLQILHRETNKLSMTETSISTCVICSNCFSCFVTTRSASLSINRG